MSRSLPGSQGASGGEGDPQHCRLLLKAGGVKACRATSQERLVRMRLLRRAVLTCQRCEARWRCDFLPLFNASIETAIAEVSQEWGLGAS